MDCVSCKVVVTDALEELKIPFYKVELGEIDTHQDVSEEDKSVLNTKLRKELNLTYTYLANFYSEVESTTIEQFMIALKIERVKELLIFGEDTISEIAYKLNYSSAAHLSTQFKRVTGLTPSHFKNLKERRRIAIQNI